MSDQRRVATQRDCRCWALVLRGRCYFVDDMPKSEDMLLVQGRGGDWDDVRELGHDMHRALYDLYQTSDSLQDGDSFQIGGRVVFRCEGVHVVPLPGVLDHLPAPAPARGEDW